MKKGQQFRIDSIEELKEAYENLKDRWHKGFSIGHEMGDFEDKNYRYIVCDNKIHINEIYLTEYLEDYETIPNPFKKYSWQRIKKALDGLGCVNLEEEKQEPDPIRKELNELRSEVEALKEMAQPISIIDLDKIENAFKEKQESINEIHKIMRESLAAKECCKEKPKESPDLKIKWNHCELKLKKYHWSNHLTLKIDDGRNECSIPIEKSEAIKIVDYLKKHFEID